MCSICTSISSTDSWCLAERCLAYLVLNLEQHCPSLLWVLCLLWHVHTEHFSRPQFLSLRSPQPVIYVLIQKVLQNSLYQSGFSRETELMGVYIYVCVCIYVYTHTHTHIKKGKTERLMVFILKNQLTNYRASQFKLFRVGQQVGNTGKK